MPRSSLAPHPVFRYLPLPAALLPAAMLLAAMLPAALAALPRAAAAQDKPAAGSSAADPLKVLANINDLGLLKALVPLKLTQDQIAKLLAVMRQIAEEGKARAKQDADALRALAAEVEKARTDALAGTPVPDDLEKRVTAAAAAADARQRGARKNAVRRILLVAKAVLTPEQRERIAAQSAKALGGRLVPREYKQDPDKAPREAVLDLAAASFIEAVLLNERAIDVLAQMKPPPAGP